MTIFNHEFDDDDDEWHDAVIDHRDLFNEIGNYHNCQGLVAEEHILEPASSLQNNVDEGTVVNMCIHHSCQLEVNKSRLHFKAHQVKPGEQDWETGRKLVSLRALLLLQCLLRISRCGAGKRVSSDSICAKSPAEKQRVGVFRLT